MSNASADPASDIIPVKTDDTVDLALPSRAIRATNAGVITITTAAGNKRACAFLAGETRAIRATRIWSTGTDNTSGIEVYV